MYSTLLICFQYTKYIKCNLLLLLFKSISIIKNVLLANTITITVNVFDFNLGGNLY